MTDIAKDSIQVPLSAEDRERVEEILESSPFTQALLLQLALRIGLQEIQRDPTVLMPFLAKKEAP